MVWRLWPLVMLSSPGAEMSTGRYGGGDSGGWCNGRNSFRHGLTNEKEHDSALITCTQGHRKRRIGKLSRGTLSIGRGTAPRFGFCDK